MAALRNLRLNKAPMFCGVGILPALDDWVGKMPTPQEIEKIGILFSCKSIAQTGGSANSELSEAIRLKIEAEIEVALGFCIR
jgi:hypothetical protein